MPLASGTRLGPYEILGPIAAGGMGEVYKARDTRLERTVAVKVLPPSLAGDPEFKARFEREARSISALNHPHICTLFDVGGAVIGSGTGRVPAGDPETVSYLVMEYLEGETLADRLKKGPIAIDTAIDLASQIADALDKAHRQGIIHRDLKPGNVFLVRAVGASGAPHSKLLDFGLAKIGVAPAFGTIETRLATSLGSPASPQSPGVTTPLTSQGTILGTFQYMAPEQIEGRDADARTDIWAFGCVLYEMLTGRRAFEGTSQASLIASILDRQPTPMTELQPLTPLALGRVVHTCLEKNPDNRFHTAHDLWLHLQWIEESGSASGVPTLVVPARKRRERLVAAGAALSLAALAAIGAWVLKPAPDATNVVTRFPVALPEGQIFTRPGRRVVAISPDGTKLAYIANRQIYLRRMHELDAQPIRGTDLDPLDLTFSPDGREIAFFTDGATGDASLQRVEATGGKGVTICRAGAPYGLRWQNGRIVFSLGDRILTVPATGGAEPETLAKAAASNELLLRPEFIGDDGTVMYTKRTGTNDQIVVQAPGGALRVLVEDGLDAHLAPTGHLLWIREGTLMAQAIDRRSLELDGGAVPLVDGVQVGASGAGQYSVSDTGTLVFLPRAAGTSDLVWVDRGGGEEPTGAPPQDYRFPRVSPDGTRVSATTLESDADILVWDLNRKTITKLTSGPEQDQFAVWTPDSRAVIFRSVDRGRADGRADVFRRNSDRTGTLERLTDTPETETPLMVTRDGARLLVRLTASAFVAEGTLTILPVQLGSKPQPVLSPSVPPQSNAEISPDERWIAYQSREGSTTPEIHVRPFRAPDSGHWQVSSGGGQHPMWSRSGKELFYVTFNATRIMSVQVQPSRPDAAFAYGTPTVVVDVGRYSIGNIFRGFDISPDDSRFLMVKPAGGAAPVMTVVAHWFDELRAKVTSK